MAAGQGFKTFTTGEVLTAGDVNGYLMQGINVFTNATARDAAITAPAEGQFAFTKDNNSLWYYDGAAWVASGATGDIEGVTVTSPLTGGGTSGTVTVGILSGTTSNLGAVQLSDSTSSTSTALAATANAVKTTYDLANGAIPKSTITTKGDLIVGTGSGTFVRQGVGADGTVLTADSAEADGVKWATPSSGGMTLISTTTLSGTSTTISSIPSTYNNLQMVFRNVGNTATSNLSIRCNGITTSSYIYNQPNNNPATSTYIGFDVGAGNVAGATYAGQVTFFDYANTATALLKQINWSAVYQMNATPAYALSTGAAGFFNSSAISSITLSTIAGTGTLSGSVLLYGVK
jgi:hypothetical protein